jgi:hypothetical protein
MSKGVDTTMTYGALVIELAANGVIVRPHHRYWESSENKIFEPGEVKVFNTFPDFCRWFNQFFPVTDVMPSGPEPGSDQWNQEKIAELSKKLPEALRLNNITLTGRSL